MINRAQPGRLSRTSLGAKMKTGDPRRNANLDEIRFKRQGGFIKC